MHAMELLKENGLVFGTSICYTSQNIESVTSDEFIQMLVEKAAGILCISTICRLETRLHRNCFPQWSREHICTTESGKSAIWNMGRDFFTMDFQNDGEFVGGCIAGGRNYFHINANGDAEPVYLSIIPMEISEKIQFLRY